MSSCWATIPPWLLDRAAHQHIQSSQWFPRIADLRAAAHRIARVQDFKTLPRQPDVDPLAARAHALERAFHREAILDPEEWLALSEEFARADRPHRAEYTLEKLRRLQYVAEQLEVETRQNRL